MPRLLFLAHRIPYPPTKGDKIRAWHMLDHLAARHKVDLGCLVDDPRARQAYLWLLAAGAPSTAPGVHTIAAQLNIVPAGMPRIPAQHRRCAA